MTEVNIVSTRCISSNKLLLSVRHFSSDSCSMCMWAIRCMRGKENSLVCLCVSKLR